MRWLAAVASAAVFWTGAAPAATGLRFDGVDDRVVVPYNVSFPTEIFSIAARIRLSEPTRRSAIIARGEDDDSWNLSWQLYVDPSGQLAVMLENERDQNGCYPISCQGQPVATCIVGDLAVADERWHHVAATRDAAGNLALYVDGQPQAVCTDTLTPSSNNFQAVSVGCTFGTIGPPPDGVEPPTWFFRGDIDEPAMWDVSLSAAEIARISLDGVDPNAVGLAGYWDFEEGEGQSVGDRSPIGNHGVLGDTSSSEPADPTWLAYGCRGDLDDSGAIDATDLWLGIYWVLQYWGPCPDCDADLNADGVVDEIDLAWIVYGISSLYGVCE